MIMLIAPERKKDFENIDNLFFAMGDKARRQIIYSLMDKSQSIKALAEPLHMTLTGVGLHIKILEGADLVITRKIGRERICEFNPKGFEIIENFAKFQRDLWQSRFDNLRKIIED